mmetsp:Transcript_10007/g.14428  ORF Transcript_10007/g.14428 Transcript_10007/m.14428 type:complete len:175 (-) Transcript_10007:695-1219(-)
MERLDKNNTKLSCSGRAKDQITALYANPPQLDPQFRRVTTIPLDHRLRMSLPVAEQWVALINHQIKVTAHNFKVLLRQHKPMGMHITTMSKIVRRQARERSKPITSKRAHSRAVQAAVKAMKAKLYAPRDKNTGKKTRRRSDYGKSRKKKGRKPSTKTATGLTTSKPTLHKHPP